MRAPVRAPSLGFRPGSGLSLAPAALAASLLLGCAAHTSPPPAAPLPSGPPPRVALLPLENLSGHAEAGDMMDRVMFVALSRSGRCETVEPGEVDAAVTELRVRTSGLLSREQVGQLCSRLGTPYLMTGTILECAMVRTPDGEVPSVGLTLRLLRGSDARVLWTGMRVRSGEDRETVFGLGRVRSLQRLAELAAEELIQGFSVPAAAETTAAGGKS